MSLKDHEFHRNFNPQPRFFFHLIYLVWTDLGQHFCKESELLAQGVSLLQCQNLCTDNCQFVSHNGNACYGATSCNQISSKTYTVYFKGECLF